VRSNWPGIAIGYGFSENPSKMLSLLTVNKLAPHTNGGFGGNNRSSQRTTLGARKFFVLEVE
jgi:hypothetical protein